MSLPHRPRIPLIVFPQSSPGLLILVGSHQYEAKSSFQVDNHLKIYICFYFLFKDAIRYFNSKGHVLVVMHVPSVPSVPTAHWPALPPGLKILAVRIPEDRIPLKILSTLPGGRRLVGRPKRPGPRPK